MSESVSQGTSAAPSVNLQTSNVQEPIEVVGGSSPVSWDELSAVSNWRKQQSSEPEPKTAQQRAESGDDSDLKLEKGEKKHAKDDQEESGQEKSRKERSKESRDEKSDQEKSEKIKSKESSGEGVKTLKFKNGDSEVELNPSAKVTVKVDGKPVEVEVQEVINRYSQQRHLDDLFRKHKAERQEFEASRSKMSDIVKKSHELLAEKKDLKGFLELMSENMGVDGQKLYSETMEKIRQVMEEESTLSPEERRLKQLEDENNYYRSKAEQAKAAQAEAAKVKQIESEVQSILESSSMTKSQFVEAYDTLIKNGFDAAQITPQQVGEYWKNLKLVETIESKLVEANPELQGNYEEVERLANLAMQTKATAEELDEVISQLYGNSAAKKLSKKISKSLKKAQVENGPKRAGSDPLFFDDI